MMKLSGWKRIGIIASVVWILGAGVHTYDSEIDRASDLIADTHVRCDSNLPDSFKNERAYEAAFRQCNKKAEDSLALAIGDARLSAAIVAFVPVPFGWGFVYLVLLLLRWVKRGFIPPQV
jgi:hypothetical protein